MCWGKWPIWGRPSGMNRHTGCIRQICKAPIDSTSKSHLDASEWLKTTNSKQMYMRNYPHRPLISVSQIQIHFCYLVISFKQTGLFPAWSSWFYPRVKLRELSFTLNFQEQKYYFSWGSIYMYPGITFLPRIYECLLFLYLYFHYTV